MSNFFFPAAYPSAGGSSGGFYSPASPSAGFGFSGAGGLSKTIFYS
jgi:hypothetical protein